MCLSTSMEDVVDMDILSDLIISYYVILLTHRLQLVDFVALFPSVYDHRNDF